MSAPTVEAKKWPIAREDPPSMSSLRPADYKEAGPLLVSLEHRGTNNDQQAHVFFSNVAVKLVGSNTWLDAQ